MLKACSRCEVEKPIADFHKNLRVKSGVFPYCKACARAAASAWQRANPERARASAARYRTVHAEQIRTARQRYHQQHRERLRLAKQQKRPERYGITWEDYNVMADRQRHCCAICRAATPLAIDHCHTTHTVRGLLCRECNTGLGKFRDNPDLLLAAVAYLNGKAF